MKSEIRPVTQGELADFIKNASDKESIEIGEPEQVVIDEVVSSFKESDEMNFHAVGRWCNNKVDQILSAHPELAEKSESIKERVRLDLMYRLNPQQFEDFKKAVEEKKPAKVTPMWIRKNVPKFPGMINRNMIGWDLVAEKTGINIEVKPSSFDEIMERVNNRLRELKPSAVSPGYIQDFLVSDYLYLRRHRDIDWETFKSKLDPEFQAIWQRRSVYDEAEPKEKYRNEEEVDSLLEEHKDKLYTVVEATSGERPEREDIIKGLVNLAKKGNEVAFEKSKEYLQFIVLAWVHEKRLDPVVTKFKDEVDDRIARSVYLYNNQGPFLTYLFVSLARLAKGLKRFSTEVEYNEGNKKHNGKSHIMNGDYDFYDEPTDDY